MFLDNKKQKIGFSSIVIFSEILVSIILATILMIFIYSLPTDNCIKNLKKSIDIYMKKRVIILVVLVRVLYIQNVIIGLIQ